ncbi:MAG: EthD family reductase [Rhodospirillales bacterium]|nr:EthD family reductase [Rhodospirillales bacterium]
MPAYVINDMEVTNPELLEKYKLMSPSTVAQYGGRFVVRGGAAETIEGEWSPKRLVILEFPSANQAKEWAHSDAYAPARAMRQEASHSNIIVVEGVPPAATSGQAGRNFTKRIGILRKREDMTYDQFHRHWLTTHAALCAKLPRLRRYAVNLVDRARFPKFGYDGFSELWFDNEEDLHAAFASKDGQILLADLPNFTSQIDPIITTETQVLWP